MRFTPDGNVWRATRTPDGPALLQISVGGGRVEARAWGVGRHCVLDGLADLLGDRDDDAGFRPRRDHPRLVQAWRRHPGWRVPRSGAVFEALAAAAIEQVVTGAESRRAWRLLLHSFGEPAPGDPAVAGGPAAGMRVPPAPWEWAAIPTWEWLRAGVDERRRRVVQVAARAAGRLEGTLALAHRDAERALRSLPGVGAWTAAEVRQRAHGDADAFSFGDYHVAKNVSWALTGTVMDDEGCAEVIECYQGHRYRVQRLLELAGVTRPRYGPRRTLPAHVSGRS